MDELAALILEHRPVVEAGITRCACGQPATLAARASGSDDLARADWAEHLADELLADVADRVSSRSCGKREARPALDLVNAGVHE